MKIRDYWQFTGKGVRTLLRDASVDDSGGTRVYMTESKAIVVDFDRVKREYMNRYHFSEEDAKSVDALFEMVSSPDHPSELVLVEFKNGKVDNRDIERKARDSVLIFQSITGTQLEDTRKHVRFVLVYNEEKNPMDYREARAMALANRGRVDFCRFGLAHLRGFCFKSVVAYSQKEFEKKIVPFIIEL